MKKRLICITILLTHVILFCTNTSATENRISADTGQIFGFIYNRTTGQPIPDANVIVSGTHVGTASQNGGYYCIDPIPQGTYIITVRVIGYEIFTQTNVKIGPKTRIDFYLKPQAIQLEPILVTATRYDHLQSEVTVSSEVLTQERIREQTGNTVGEITESIGGLYTRSYDGLAGPQIPSIRGSNPDQVLVLLDDQRLNTAQGGGVDLNMFPVEAVERIEIIRGGHSALLGTDAVGGVIHIISNETVVPRGFSYGIRTTMGSFGSRTVNISGIQRIGPLSTFLSYNKTKSEGDFTFKLPDSGEMRTRKNNDYDADNLFLKTKLDVGANHRLQFLFQSLDTERGVIGSIDFPSPNARRDEKRQLFSLMSENILTNRFRIKEHLYYHTYNNHYIDSGGWIPTDDLHKNSVYGIDIHGQWTIGRHLIVNSGAEFKEDKLNSTKFTTVKRNTQSLYVMTEISYSLPIGGIQSQWKWIPAIRWSRYSDVDSRFCPKVGMLASVGHENKLAVRGNIGQSYRVPTFNDLYWPEDFFTKGNPSLTPETSTNVDVGLSYTRRRRVFFNVEITYFYNAFKDLILWEADGTKWAPRNVGKTQITGLESAMTIRLPSNFLYVKMAHTWMKAVDKTPDSPDYGNRLIYRPDYKFDISTGIDVSPFTVNVNYRVVGKRFTDPGNTRTLPEYRFLNGNLGFFLPLSGIRVDIRLQAMNLLKKSIYLLEGYPLPGREYRISIGLHY
jgi:outer membrane cobalamin receptor